jgi:threonine aldolase
MADPVLGQIVYYMLSQRDADAVNRHRTDYMLNRDAVSSGPGPGYVAHIGTDAKRGDVLPATVVALHYYDQPAANLQVHLDGTDTFWAAATTEGPGEEQWQRSVAVKSRGEEPGE